MTDLSTPSCRSAGRLIGGLIAAVLLAPAMQGCTSFASAGKQAIPSSRLDRHFLTESKEAYGPVPHTALGQPKPKAHIIGPGDYLSAYVFGVFPPTQDETPILQRFQTLNQRYYPPRGEIQGPSTGLPVEVFADGTIQLPLVGAVDVAGLTVPEAISKVKRLYIDAEVFAEDVTEEKARVQLALITPRVVRVNVLRQDALFNSPNFEATQAIEKRTRGGGEVIDLPVYENDVLHALTATGGLPGTDAPRAVFVFRQSAFKTPTAIDAEFLEDMASAVEINGCNAHVTKIPLVWLPGEALPYGPNDIILNEGDVLFVPRRNEHFYTGGLLRGAKIPLPRDEDIDILEAIALATGSTGGPVGLDGSALQAGRPGYVLPPTRAIVIRELPDGRSMRIRVDLDRARLDAKHRIFIKEDDLVLLTFKPGRGAANTILNLFNLSLLVNPQR